LNLTNWDQSGFDKINSFNFENYMKSLKWTFCQNCKEKHLSSTSVKCVHGKICGDFTEANDMDPGDVPDELKRLSFVEEQLITQVHPLISVFKMKGLQYGYTGNVINFHQSVESFVEELPRKVSDLSSVLTVRFANEKVEARDFSVRGPKVFNALLWLKRNNPFYEHINISMDNVNSLPVDGNVYEEIQSVFISESDCNNQT